MWRKQKSRKVISKQLRSETRWEPFPIPTNCHVHRHGQPNGWRHSRYYSICQPCTAFPEGQPCRRHLREALQPQLQSWMPYSVICFSSSQRQECVVENKHMSWTAWSKSNRLPSGFVVVCTCRLKKKKKINYNKKDYSPSIHGWHPCPPTCLSRSTLCRHVDIFLHVIKPGKESWLARRQTKEPLINTSWHGVLHSTLENTNVLPMKNPLL